MANATSRLADYVKGNEETRQQIESLVGGLSISQLALQAEGSDWTIAAELAHLAFWDRLHTVQLADWERTGEEPNRPTESDSANDAAIPQWLALPPTVAARQALEAGREVDAAIAALPDWLVEAIEATGRMHFLSRVEHRREHLVHIELTLSNCGC
jgi:hypothetical protein